MRFARATARLGTSQPALSEQIQYHRNKNCSSCKCNCAVTMLTFSKSGFRGGKP
ncbi:MAG: helix-turn-helix domain-containing protein [Acidobacteriota bacterium]